MGLLRATVAACECGGAGGTVSRLGHPADFRILLTLPVQQPEWPSAMGMGKSQDLERGVLRVCLQQSALGLLASSPGWENLVVSLSPTASESGGIPRRMTDQ